jgi:hypothetical protein
LRQLNDNSRSINAEAFVMNGGGAASWQANHAYAVNDLAQPSYGNEDGCWYQCVVAVGPSAATEPDWPGEIGGTVLDGGVLWIGVGFGFTNGQTVPYPTSGIDGYVYSAADTILYWPYWYWTGAVQAGTYILLGPSAVAARIQRLQKSVTARVVNCTVTYWNGSTQTVTNDGLIGVVALCFRAGAGTGLPTRSAYVEFNGSEFMAGQVPTDSNAAHPANNAGMQDLNANANFARLRPEGFLSTGKTNLQTIALPTSASDSYAYARSEILNLTNLADTGNQSGDYAIRGIVFFTDPQLGTISTRVDYYKGGNPQTTTNGSYNVIALASAKSESLLTGVNILPLTGGSSPAPPGTSNLIPNGDMELWSSIQKPSTQLVGVPDLWSVSQNTADGYNTQQPGITGLYSMGCDVGNAHGAANTQYSVNLSYPVAIVPGDSYQFSLQAYANPAISQGLYCRLHFRDANLANDVYVSVPLTGGGALGTSAVSFLSRFFMPVNGDTTVQTVTWGALSIVGTLNFVPAYILVEIGNFQPNISSTIIFDTVTLLHLAQNTSTPTNATGTITGGVSPLAQSGTTTTINVAASTWQFADQQVSYNSGSVNPGAYGTYWIYADDPQLRGGAVTYQATTVAPTALAAVGRLYFGKITTTSGGGGTGSGGGSGGGGTGGKGALE